MVETFFGLSFLSPSQVQDGLVALFSISPGGAKVTSLSNYVLTNYIEQRCFYPPQMWMGTPSKDPGITNCPESYHRHMKNEFYHLKLDSHKFIAVLNEFQVQTYIKLQT